MGILRESCDPYNKLPSSLLFGSDFPLSSGILLNDRNAYRSYERGLRDIANWVIEEY